MTVPDIPRLSATASTAEVVSALRTAGACIIEDLVTTDELDQIRAQMEPFVCQTALGHNDFTGTATRRTGGLIARSASARGLLSHPQVLSAVGAALAPGEGVQLSNTEIISIGAGESAQPLHRDQEVWPFAFPAGYHPEVSVMWPLNEDFTVQNGATRVVPGSHREPSREDYPGEDVRSATMRRGSVLLWFGSTFHGGGANSSPRVRQGINAAYSVAWLRQEENQFLATPPCLACELDDDLLSLLGYSRPIPGLGNAVDRSDPLSYLRSESQITAPATRAAGIG